MRTLLASILLLVISAQCFQQWWILIAFKAKQSYLSKEVCVNRYRPKMHCNGNCVLMKKWKQEEKKDNESLPGSRLENEVIIISSRTFFPYLVPMQSLLTSQQCYTTNQGKPIDRAIPVFKPPLA